MRAPTDFILWIDIASQQYFMDRGFVYATGILFQVELVGARLGTVGRHRDGRFISCRVDVCRRYVHTRTKERPLSECLGTCIPKYR